MVSKKIKPVFKRQCGDFDPENAPRKPPVIMITVAKFLVPD
jgi:hypothetical protein